MHSRYIAWDLQSRLLTSKFISRTNNYFGFDHCLQYTQPIHPVQGLQRDEAATVPSQSSTHPVRKGGDTLIQPPATFSKGTLDQQNFSYDETLDVMD